MRAGYVESGPDERGYGTSTAWWESPATGQNLGLACAGNSMVTEDSPVVGRIETVSIPVVLGFGSPVLRNQPLLL